MKSNSEIASENLKKECEIKICKVGEPMVFVTKDSTNITSDVVFAAAGGVGVGAINETKTRAEAGNKVFIVGVDVDQYDEGLLTDGSSVILTSAMKHLGRAAYDQINAYANGEFEGGRTILMDVNANGVGLPEANPNLSDETIKQVNEAAKMIREGEIEVPKTKDGLISFLDQMNCGFGNLGY